MTRDLTKARACVHASAHLSGARQCAPRPPEARCCLGRQLGARKGGLPGAVTGRRSRLREELRQLKQGAHRWDCIQYRYGYLTRTLLADPNASRCANALWLQRREIEELGLAKPGDWGTSVGVTLL